MCGRYAFFSDEENSEIRKIAEMVEKNCKGGQVPYGEIFPSNNAVILLGNCSKTFEAELMRWGFANYKTNAQIINARSETAATSIMFSKSLSKYRCVVPSTGFYEWAKEIKEEKSIKRKYIFNLKEEKMIYMAGIFNEKERRFAILTTAANDSVKPVHNRMPLILNKKNLRQWIYDTNYALNFIKETPPQVLCNEV